ncbi:MAG: hypothetical protein ACYDGY_02425 [Acidimicrobiales bacterium]
MRLHIIGGRLKSGNGYTGILKAAGAGTGALMLAAGLAACSSSPKQSTELTTTKAVTTTTLTPLQKVEQSPATTLGKGSAEVAMSVSGKNIKTSLASFATLDLAVAGPFSFSTKEGTLKLDLKGSGTIDPATVLGGPTTTLFAGGNLYVEPNAGSLVATLAAGKKYIQLNPAGLSTLLGIPATEVSAVVSDPAGLLNILSTPDMAITDMGSSTVGGGSTEYKAVVNLTSAASQPGTYQPLFKALSSTGGSSSDTIYVYLDSSGEIVHLNTSVTIPAKGATPATTIALGVALSKFGVPVPPVTAPAPALYKAL